MTYTHRWAPFLGTELGLGVGGRPRGEILWAAPAVAMMLTSLVKGPALPGVRNTTYDMSPKVPLLACCSHSVNPRASSPLPCRKITAIFALIPKIQNDTQTEQRQSKNHPDFMSQK